jgi:predicted  nucleic acid-binding Zn-ribbon protein
MEQLRTDAIWLRSAWETEIEANKKLIARRDELLTMIANLSQAVPLDSEVAGAIDAQRSLIAEVGTLKARVAELEREKAERDKPREYVNMATEYDGTDYG